MKTAQRQARRWTAMGPILACGDTNAAVDNLVEGLVHKGLRVVRLGQPAKVREGSHLTQSCCVSRPNNAGRPLCSVLSFDCFVSLPSTVEMCK